MKYLLSLLLCLACGPLFAQINTDAIYGRWVKTGISYKDGGELPDENILKNTYVKYTFSAPDKMNISQEYYLNGTGLVFEISGNEIIMRSAAGSIMNEIRIVVLSGDKMVLLQKGYQGFDDPTALKYTFTRETTVQNRLTLNAGDIFTIKGSDTVYKQNPKVYASYKGESFQRFIYDHIGDGDYMTGRIGYEKASFIVSKTGVADSLRILESIDADFDKRFIKAFNKAKKDWKPAVLNSKYVPVEMFVELRYSTSDSVLPAQQYSEKALAAYREKDYQLALYYYDEALKKRADDTENLYNRGMCKKMLGNLAGACEDWKKIAALGKHEADELLAKYCH